MFCYQCEQTAKGLGCDKLGVCGKQPDVSDLQDLLVYALTGLGQAAVAAKAEGVTVPLETGRFFAKAMFSTLTNVNFDAADFKPLIEQTVAKRTALAAGLKTALPEGPATFKPAADLAGLIAQGAKHGLKDIPEANDDIRSLSIL